MTLDARRARDRKRAKHTVVLLNGQIVPFCFYADGRRGVVRRWDRSPDGLRHKLRMRNGELSPRWIEDRGHVTWREKPA